MKELADFIRDVPDFPKAGIIFKDITPLLSDAGAFRRTVEMMKKQVGDLDCQAILGIESRGFLFAGALALELGLGVLIARKPGKLPYHADSVSYDLEYGSATLQLHTDAVQPGQRVLIVDDLLATGGTARACAEQGGKVAGFAFVIELAFLNGRSRLAPHPVRSLLVYD